mgnify:CR=1 FL=1
MGLFSSKKIITVSSTLYNMAGDEDDRPDFLKGTLFGAVMADSPSLADEITGSYFEGPGQKQLQFFRFCQQVNYSVMPTASVVNSNPLDSTIVGGQIPLTPVPPAPAGLQISAYQAFVSDGDFEPWIEKWILANHPDRIGEEWLGEYEPSTETFSVEFPNNDFFSFPNDGSEVPLFDSTTRYIVAKYIEFADEDEGDLNEGTPTTGETSLPDVTGWDQVSDTSTFTNITLQRTRTTVKSYNNGDPDVTTEDNVDADVADTLNTAEEEYTRDVVISQNGIEMQGERQWWYFTGTDSVVGGYSNTVVTTNDLGGGVIETVTSTTTGEQVEETWTTQYDTKDLFIGKQYGPEQVFIYEVGSGNTTLDALVDESDTSGFQEFFPFVPVRINNVSITEPQYEDLYDENDKKLDEFYSSLASMENKAETQKENMEELDSYNHDCEDYYLPEDINPNMSENEANEVFEEYGRCKCVEYYSSQLDDIEEDLDDTISEIRDAKKIIRESKEENYDFYQESKNKINLQRNSLYEAERRKDSSKRKLNLFREELDNMMSEINQSLDKVSESTHQLSSQISSDKLSDPVIVNIKAISKDIDFVVYMFPLIYFFILMFVSTTFSASFIFSEKNSYANNRNILSPLSRAIHFCCAHLSLLILISMQAIVLLFLGKFLLDIPMSLNIGLKIIFLTMLTLAFFILLGIIIGYLLESQLMVLFIAIGTTAILFLYSGIIVPEEIMSDTTRMLISINPYLLATRAGTQLILFNLSLEEIITKIIIILIEFIIMIGLFWVIGLIKGPTPSQ